MELSVALVVLAACTAGLPNLWLLYCGMLQALMFERIHFCCRSCHSPVCAVCALLCPVAGAAQPSRVC